MRFIIFIALFAIYSSAYAQHCPDTASIAGYYISSMTTEVLKPWTIKVDGKKLPNPPIDIRKTWMFLPKDSITAEKPLSNWLSNFNPQHTGVYSVSRYHTRKFLKRYSCSLVGDSTELKGLSTWTFYRAKERKLSVYNIFYVEADWIKVNISSKSLEGNRGIDQYSRFAIPDSVDSYFVHAMYRLRKLDREPVISDPHVEKVVKTE